MPTDANTAITKSGAARWARGRLAPAAAVSKKRKTIALAVAAAADILQLAVFPAFVEGALSPFEDALDVVVAIALLAILGFRWRLAFAFALELVPGADLFPTWTGVVISLPTLPDEAPALPPAPRGPMPPAMPAQPRSNERA